MEVEINMINVEDGDAIFLMLRDNNRKSLIIIDGGYRKHYHKVRKRLIEILPEYDNKIDLLVCTHYDNDHISGVEYIIDDFHSCIQQIWIHKIDTKLETTTQILEAKIIELGRFAIIDSWMKRLKMPVGNRNRVMLLEAYRDLLRVISKIKSYGLEDKIIEPFAGMTFSKFPELSVVSPDPHFYNANLKNLKIESLFEDLEKGRPPELPKQILRYKVFTNQNTTKPVGPCEMMATSSLAAGVTATNMVSIVLLLQAKDKKYLFTGDAGIESLTIHTSGWENLLNDLYFLGLPHHGSKNNLSKAQLDIFNPEIVLVSASNRTNRPSEHIKECVKSRERINIFEVTNSNPSTWYLKLDKDGELSRVQV
jgi:beta-lactamase superfamily II metal-dependent hydrolase